MDGLLVTREEQMSQVSSDLSPWLSIRNDAQPPKPILWDTLNLRWRNHTWLSQLGRLLPVLAGQGQGCCLPHFCCTEQPPLNYCPTPSVHMGQLWETLVKVTADGSLLHDIHTDQWGENSQASGGAQKWDLGALRNIICTFWPPEPPDSPFCFALQTYSVVLPLFVSP